MSTESERSDPIALVRQLGKGGMATVHEARVAGRTVALKRPRRDVLERRPETRLLFEREYYTLAQLAHPNIIEVFAYGVDVEGPYYTMELLDGGSLSDLSPMEWPRVCRILCDVAAALALVHSRRLVHRDVSLHNVRLGQGGRAKLIDFGAMTPIGIPSETIGTPAYMAPEAVYRQALDQRTDLYALGALGYRLISGQDAYRARRIDQLRDAWRTRPRPLAEHIGVPSALDALLHQLLSLNPAGRCRTAAEVIVRLRAIANLEPLDNAELTRAYLTMPTLVGREHELSVTRRQILHAVRGTGSASLVEGPVGAGRSRFLDACILDGELLGAHVLRARAAPGASASFGLIARLVAQLIENRPSSYPSSPRLQALLNAGGLTPASAEEQSATQQDLVDWFMQATTKPLLLIVDDLHLADLESAAVLARIVDLAPKQRWMVIASAPSDAQSLCGQALRLIRERALPLALPPLSEEQTAGLVRSLFDDVVNVQLAAKRIYEVARGNPRATVELAEWLVDGSHVVQEGGHWLIPDTLSGLPLPASVDDALRQRLSTLDAGAIRLAAAIAIAADAELPESDYGLLLLGDTDEGAVQVALARLVSAQVLIPNTRGHGLAQAAYRGLLMERMGQAACADLHARIAEACLARQQTDWGIYHLFYGQAPGRAVDLFLTQLKAGRATACILPSLEERVAWLREMLDFCRREQRPLSEIFALKNELIRRAEIKVSLVRQEVAELSEQYKDLSGFTDWLTLPSTMDASSRVGAALKAAAIRHMKRSEQERVVNPREAVLSMVEFVSACLASATANSEIGILQQMPPLAPFAPLSDSIRLLARYMEAVEATIGGRPDVASATFIEVLTELDGETGARLGSMADRLKRHALIAIGMLNAGLSRSIALDYADRLAALAVQTDDPYAKSTSLRVRHQYHLRRGNFRQAQHWQREAELDKLTDRSAVFNPSGIYALSWIHATVGNVAGMRECLTQMREYSAVSQGLQIWERYMSAEYDRLRGASEQAIPEYLTILDSEAGRHMAWLYAAHGVLLCYEGLERFAEGKQLGERLLAQAEAAELHAARGLILRPLALIEARLGHFEQAIAYLSENIARCKQYGMGGINLGVAYEFRARVAIWAGDKEAFERDAELCAEHYHAGGGSPELTARMETLFDEARKHGVVEAQWLSRELSPMTLTHAQVELRDRLADCQTAKARCLQALQALAHSANAAGGYFYGATEHGLTLLASVAVPAATADAQELSARVFGASTGRAETTESAHDAARTESESTESITGGFRAELSEGFLPQLLCRARGLGALGVFLFQPGPEAPRWADQELLEIVADCLLHAGDLHAP